MTSETHIITEKERVRRMAHIDTVLRKHGIPLTSATRAAALEIYVYAASESRKFNGRISFADGYAAGIKREQFEAACRGGRYTEKDTEDE